MFGLHSAAPGGGFDGKERIGARSDGRKQGRSSADGCGEDRVSVRHRSAAPVENLGLAVCGCSRKALSDAEFMAVGPRHETAYLVSCDSGYRSRQIRKFRTDKLGA